MNIMPSRAMPESILVTPMEGRLTLGLLRPVEASGRVTPRKSLRRESRGCPDAKVSKRRGDDLDRDFPEGGG